MSKLLTLFLIISIVSFALLSILEAVSRSRSWVRTGLDLGSIGLVVFILYILTGFPYPRQAFGGASPVVAVGLMFFCVLLGMIARYFFYQRGAFSWRRFLRPMCVSPIVLLPLIGTLEAQSSMTTIQLISIAVLAFQNGFFWTTVVEHARMQNT
jgi:1,4-dihydroxy-2-naphthoate octaprenyltransferase